MRFYEKIALWVIIAYGYTSRASEIIFLPAVALILLLVLAALPRIEPLRSNIEAFRYTTTGSSY